MWRIAVWNTVNAILIPIAKWWMNFFGIQEGIEACDEWSLANRRKVRDLLRKRTKKVREEIVCIQKEIDLRRASLEERLRQNQVNDAYARGIDEERDTYHDSKRGIK